MKMINQMKKYAPRFNRAKAAVGGGLMMAAMSVHAAVPDAVKTSIEGSKTDGLEVGWIVVGVVAALFVIKIVKGLIR